MVLLHTIVLMLGAAEPGPLDAFRANYAGTRVDTRFTYAIGSADRDLIIGGALWKTDEVGFIENAVWRVAGRWECDGTAAHLVCAPSGKAAEEAARSERSNRGLGRVTSLQEPVEALFDGETGAFHELGEGRSGKIHLEYVESPALVHHGPYMWFGPLPFPRDMNKDFEGLEPERRIGNAGGRSTELHVYRKPHPGGWNQAEIHYDPSIGYLPRFLRLVGIYSDPSGRSICAVKDMYMTDARPCAAGGFVPTEWYVASYGLDSGYSDYQVGDVLRPGSDRVALSHYKTTAFKDRIGPVQMDQLDGVKFIAGVGGVVPVQRSPTLLTLGQLKSRLGQRKMTVPSRPVGPSIDSAELNENFPARPRSYWHYCLAAVLAAITFIAFIRRRRSQRPLTGLACFLACLTAGSGCGYGGKPIVHLAASFDRPQFVNEASEPLLSLAMVVRNEGNQAVRVFGVSGGCSCRKVDESHLPADLSPGDELKLPVQIRDTRDPAPQYMTFTYSTNLGALHTPVALQVLPKHQVRPAAVTLSLLEDEAGTFEFSHRTIYRAGEPAPESRPVVPAELSETERSTSGGPVEALPGYNFRDTVYGFRLNERGFGLRKTSIALEGADHSKIIDVAVVYTRRRFLHSAPETVYLGASPVRVFLTCPDESVELTRVTSTPPGVRATLSSTNEVIIRLGGDAPDIINGVVKVLTTAKSQDPELRIPVIRYSRRPLGSASSS